MKTPLTKWVLPAVGIGLLGGALFSATDSRAQVDTREVMKAKLQYAQSVLEGLATEDFAAIEANAGRLSRLSKAAGWKARQTPEYELFTTEFRRQAEALEEAARKQNLDAASIAYVQMTLSCVSCHKYMRGKKVAGIPSLRPAL